MLAPRLPMSAPHTRDPSFDDIENDAARKSAFRASVLSMDPEDFIRFFNSERHDV